MTERHKDSEPAKGGGFPAEREPDDGVRGIDARRKADRVAEEAGRKARNAARKCGETPEETGGPQGLEPTRYGDWEKAGRCIDF